MDGRQVSHILRAGTLNTTPRCTNSRAPAVGSLVLVTDGTTVMGAHVAYPVHRFETERLRGRGRPQTLLGSQFGPLDSVHFGISTRRPEDFDMLASLCVEKATRPDATSWPRIETDTGKDASVSLDVLNPLSFQPARSLPSEVRPEDALKQIEGLRVDKPHRHVEEAMFVVSTVYTVKIYKRDPERPNPHPSRIPVHRRFGETTKQPIKPAKPSAIIHVSFDNFMQFRYDAYEIARSSHIGAPSCAFCQRVMAMNASSKSMPRWSMMYFKTDKNVRGMLTTYLTEMLQLAHVASGNRCKGQERFPRLLLIFLRCVERE